ncbi:MAG: sugar phosphate isomerase/epimerase [Cyclobacteriaceae bacterium]|nr:sugar phosphate isomerase/epimerase [Cyclobacteriaceae bacterium]
MTKNRRLFLKYSGLSASGLLLMGLGCKPSSEGSSESADTLATVLPETVEGKSLDQFGIQLYTMRDILPADPKGVMTQIANMGYKQLEGYEGDMGLWWGMPHTDFKKFLDDQGLNFVSSHCDTNKDFERKAAEAAEVGAKYLISPWIGPQKSIEDYKKYADQFNQLGEVCKSNGLRFAYHNHGYSFEELEGQMPQEVMMNNTDPELVDFEMDIFWVVTANADPIAWMEKHSGRFTLCHVKDREKNAPAGEGDASCILGEGSIDFDPILKAAEANGMKYYILEQEKYANTTPIDCAKAGAEYLRNVRV